MYANSKTAALKPGGAYPEHAVRRVERRMALSSTYLAEADYAYAQAAASFWRKPWWIVRARSHLSRACLWSDAAECECGIARLTLLQLLERSIVLCRAKRYKDAIRCVDEALSRESDSISNDIKIRLFVVKAESMHERGKDFEADSLYESAWGMLGSDTLNSTTVLIGRSYGAYYMHQGNMESASKCFLTAMSALGEDSEEDIN